MKRRPYEYERAEKLENYVRRRYRSQLSNGAMRLYLALSYLEKQQLGLCAPITAEYPKLMAAGNIARGTVKPALEQLRGVLCEVKIGKPIKAGLEATQIRRYTLSELMNDEQSRKLIDYTPPDAKHLAELLRERSFVYGKNPICKPYWNPTIFGKIQSKQPDIHQDSPTKRAASLCAGLMPEQVLIHADFKSAEPTIIKYVLGTDFETCTYKALMELLSIGKKEAKRMVNTLAYANSAVKIVPHWTPEAQSVFMPYAEALDNYKKRLWSIGTPRNKQRRFAHTLGGSKVVAAKGGEQIHHGQPMNWHIAGTVADITNGACLKIIEQEPSKHWKLCFPEHDAVYVIGKPEQAEEIKALMEAEAQRLGLSLPVEVEIFTADYAVLKLEQ